MGLMTRVQLNYNQPSITSDDQANNIYPDKLINRIKNLPSVYYPDYAANLYFKRVNWYGPSNTNYLPKLKVGLGNYAYLKMPLHETFNNKNSVNYNYYTIATNLNKNDLPNINELAKAYGFRFALLFYTPQQKMTVELINIQFASSNKLGCLGHFRAILINSTYLVFEIEFNDDSILSFKTENIISNDTDITDRIFKLELDCNYDNNGYFRFSLSHSPTPYSTTSSNIFNYYLQIPELYACIPYLGTSYGTYYDGLLNEIGTVTTQGDNILICGQYGAGSTTYGSNYYSDSGGYVENLEPNDENKSQFAIRSVSKTNYAQNYSTNIPSSNFITSNKKISLDSNTANLTSDDDILGIYIASIHIDEYYGEIESNINTYADLLNPITISVKEDISKDFLNPISINVKEDIDKDLLNPIDITIPETLTPVDPFNISITTTSHLKPLEEVEDFINKKYLGTQQAAEDFQLLMKVTETSYWPVEFTIDNNYHIHIKPDPIYIGAALYACTNKQFLYHKYAIS